MNKSLLTFLFAAAAAPLSAVNYSTPFIDPTLPGASSSVAFGGQSFVNKGLVGVGVYSPNLLDGRGDTYGSFSSFKVDYSSWRKNSDGSYSGTLFTLPDRGYNVAGLIAYPARIQQMALSFTPDYTTNPAAQNQLTLTFQRTIAVTDFTGGVSTAVDPVGSVSLQGYTNVATAGGQFSIDGEGLVRRADGTFYISDEYGATIYHVASDGRMLGLITPPQALLPQYTGASGFTGFTTASAAVSAQTGGRRDNQGMEAVDLTPDGRYLVSMLQSATRQDNPTDVNQGRLYTRLMVYDVSASATPTAPVGHYLVELPTFDRDGVGGTADRTAAQSEILALSPTSFLVLTRDGNGNGSGDNARPLVFKTVSLVSLTGATNLAGTVYETTYTPAAAGTAGTTPGIVAAQVTPFVNLLNASQLSRFGIDMNVGAEGSGSPISANSLGEKWEALSLVPVLDPLAPNDYFLLVGNDNDFLGTSVTMLGGAPVDATAGATLAENPNRVLVYRVTLPGYVDAGLVQSAQTTGAYMMSGSLRTVQTMGTSFGGFLSRRMTGSLRLAAPSLASSDDSWLVSGQDDLCSLGMPSSQGVASGKGLRWWFDGSFRDVSEEAFGVNPALDSSSLSGAVGLEWSIGGGFSFGLGIGMQDGKSDGSDNSAVDYKGTSVTAYVLGRGEKAFGSLAFTAGRQDFDLLQRAGAYGSAPFGETHGNSLSIEATLGMTVAEVAGWAVTPAAGLSHSRMAVDAYTETGGFGPLAFSKQVLERSVASASVELARSLDSGEGRVTPFFRAGFDHEFGGDAQSSTVAIASGSGAGTSFAVSLPDSDRDYMVGGVGARWEAGDFRAELSYEHRSGDSGYREHRINLGLSSSF
ncbi:MAG: hypothetical protein RL105_369 [Verrucomicrobiota bacterium]|jgi:hypothetical protein